MELQALQDHQATMAQLALKACKARQVHKELQEIMALLVQPALPV